jgi:predicted Ser/Thr protein kinase
MHPEAIALFRELADRSPAEREEYYARQRVPAGLRDEVESLLRFDGDTVDPFPQRIGAAANVMLGGGLATDSRETRSADHSLLRSELIDGRFPPGTLLGGRYRVVSLLGRGGMGEVYRATDLKLKQPVALKFLPEAAARDARLLARLHGEVRLARQISHPNVCRVYDIGELEGTTFIAMEYIDGEDLASLLRRIGRLPHDKALEIARKLCAGLAAAHDKGVVHRDLKPGNVMIDSRGQVLITDFGLASTARDGNRTPVRSGTPAYMAPEQLAGREVSVRSDLYALGLVLYEMFTGRAPYTEPRQPADRPPSLSSVARDVDVTIVRAIERCLEHDPRDRPSSALAVAAALPGGNPLAEALAAGVTPSPQMVAAAHGSESLSIRSAVITLTFVIAGLAALVVFGSRVSFLHVTPFPYPPQVLEQKARELLASFGYGTPPLDRDWAFFWNGLFKSWAEQNEPREEYRAELARGQRPILQFNYRQSPRYLLFFDPAGDVITQEDPPLRGPGDVFMALDLHGRLRILEVVSPEEEYSSGPHRTFDWDELFTAADIDRSRFADAQPQWIPPLTFDTRAAWTGSLAHAPSVPVRVEAAAWRGRPVYFRTMTPSLQLYGPVTSVNLSYIALLLVAGGAALVAYRNYVAGRSDLWGASSLGAVIFGCSLLSWVLTAHHVPVNQYFPAVFRGINGALAVGVLGGLLYMAVEPFVRRRWPQSLISWTRVLSGRIRDPLVGGHVLVGAACGIGLALWLTLKMTVLLRQGYVTALDWRMLHGPGWIVMSVMWNLVWFAVTKALAVLVLFLLARVAFRRDWLAIVVVALMASLVTILDRSNLPIEMAFEVPAAAVSVWLLIRLGLLPMVVAFFVNELVIFCPLTVDFSAWYSGPTLAVLATVGGLAVWSFSVARAGRPLFEDELVPKTA